MQIILVAGPGPASFGRPVVRLARETVMRHFEPLDYTRAFLEPLDFAIYVRMVAMEFVGFGVPMDSPEKPGRVGYRKSESALTIDVHYNEISMVLDRVQQDKPGGRTIPASRDFVDVFVERIEAAVAPMIAWCDRRKAWADRDYYMAHWDAARAALAAGDLARPYEFALTPLERDALDKTWRLVAATPLTSESHDTLAKAYLHIHNVAWQGADYEADLTQEITRFGQPTKLANPAANKAKNPPPDMRSGYSLV